VLLLIQIQRHRSWHYGFVLNPLTLVTHGTVGKELYTLAVRHAIQPFTLVATSILPSIGAKATVPTIFPRTIVPTAVAEQVETVALERSVAETSFVPTAVAKQVGTVALEHSVAITSFVPTTVAKQVGTVALEHSVAEISFVTSTVWPGKVAVSVAFVFPIDAVVGAAIAPGITTTAVTLIESVLAFVSITAGKRSPSESVPSETEKGSANVCVSNKSNTKSSREQVQSQPSQPEKIAT
jgi:hypothetical protein